MYCKYCGATVSPNSEFCKNCDKKIQEEVPEMKLKREWARVFLLSIFSSGFYYIYWYYITSKMVKKFLREDYSPGLRTIGLFVPILNLLMVYYLVDDVSQLQEEVNINPSISPGWMLVLAIFTQGLIFPAITQNGFNHYLDIRTKNRATISNLSVGEILFIIFCSLYWISLLF